MLSNSLSLTGEDKVIVTAILAIAFLVLGAVIVSTFANAAVQTIITSITPAAITAISILAARHPPTTAVSTPADASLPAQAAPASPASPTSPATIA